MNLNSIRNIIPQIILIVILTIINAFFASAEMAIVSLNKNKLKLMADEGNKKAELLIKLLKEPSKFLATIQVGITLAGFFSSASAATGISDDFSRYLIQFNIPYSKQISIVLITIILSYITLVFGELFPKRLAMQKSQEIAMFSIKPIYFIAKIMVPFVKLLSVSTNFLVRISGINRYKLEEKITEEELKLFVEVGQEHGVINQTEKKMINSIFEFDDKLAQEVMTPRTEAFIINIKIPAREILEQLINEKFSRIPVYEFHKDNIIGILFLRDLFAMLYKNGFEDIDIRTILHPPYFVPETKHIDELFKELQSHNKHMAILIDEYGGFSGIVTIEDLIEEVMGEIYDEFDDGEEEIIKIDSNSYLVSGLVTIHELNTYLDLSLDSENSDTIGGFVVNILGSIPTSKEELTVEYDDIIFIIKEVKRKRISRIKIILQGKLMKNKDE
ncbi:hemolysin family protein [Clostridium sediminicola]|uniref:hemolysin family protein n=1 Tax=Clostridium sediminicola TaxID=3114879 RepID=UPI003D16C056